MPQEECRPNEEHVAVIEGGAGAWNSWRDANPEVRPDLAGAFLPTARLSGAHLQRTDLRGAILAGANLVNAELDDSRLQEADFTDAELAGASLRRTDCRKAVFRWCDLERADLRGASLGSTLFDHAKLGGADLRGAELIHASFDNAHLEGIRFDPDAVLSEGVTLSQFLREHQIARRLSFGPRGGPLRRSVDFEDSSRRSDDIAPDFDVLQELLEQLPRPQILTGSQYAEPEASLDSEAGFAEVELCYATDRQRTGESAPNRIYGRKRGELEFGTALVTIPLPPSHRIGDLERPKWWRFEFSEARGRHVVLEDVSPLDRTEFVERARGVLRQADREPEVLVFVHGYNVSFAEAARRTAQIAYDLQFPGMPLLFSWPSQARFRMYTVDETNIRWTTPHFQEVLNTVLCELGASDIHVVAHSMGNRALLETVRVLDLSKLPSDAARLHEIVLAAPDFDADTFAGLAKRLSPASARRLTLYASSNDKALKASKWFHGYQRAGDTRPEIVIAAGVESIDASQVDTSLMGHSYVGSNRTILTDVAWLLQHHDSPDKRHGLDDRKNSSGKYWFLLP